MANFAHDARYMDIGDLPSGGATYSFDRIYVRQFVLRELPLLHHGMTARVRPHQHIIRAVSMACSVDINELTDGDFCYVMAWLRRQSFPDFPVQAKYTCNAPVWVNKKTNGLGDAKLTKADAQRLGYVRESCGAANNELVHQTEIVVYTLDDNDLTIDNPEIDFPRVATLTDFHEYVDENPHMKYNADLARWVRKGKNFRAKLSYLNSQKDMSLFEEIEEVKKKYFHGITEKIRLRCGQCNSIRFNESEPSLLKFFADNTEKDIFNMIYNLMSQFGVPPDMDMPVKMFMYHHNQLAADRRAAEQRAREAANKTGHKRF